MVVHSYLFPHAAWTEEQMSVSDRCSSIVDIVDAVLGTASRRTRKHFQVAEYPFAKVGHKHYSGCMENRAFSTLCSNSCALPWSWDLWLCGCDVVWPTK